jgi:hypothetical protein
LRLSLSANGQNASPSEIRVRVNNVVMLETLIALFSPAAFVRC